MLTEGKLQDVQEAWLEVVLGTHNWFVSCDLWSWPENLFKFYLCKIKVVHEV